MKLPTQTTGVNRTVSVILEKVAPRIADWTIHPAQLRFRPGLEDIIAVDSDCYRTCYPVCFRSCAGFPGCAQSCQRICTNSCPISVVFGSI